MGSLDRRILLAIGFAAVVSVVQLVYCISVIATAEKYIIEYDGLYWRTSPAGSLFPWPRGSGMLQALSPANAVDQAIYSMVTSNLYIPVFLGLTLLAAALGYLIAPALSR